MKLAYTSILRIIYWLLKIFLLYIPVFMWNCFSPLPPSVPVGTLDIWYMKQNISSNRQRVSLFWKVSFQFKTQGEYILNWVWEHYGFHMARELRQFHDTWRNIISTPAQFPSPKFTSMLCPTLRQAFLPLNYTLPFCHRASKTVLAQQRLSV